MSESPRCPGSDSAHQWCCWSRAIPGCGELWTQAERAVWCCNCSCNLNWTKMGNRKVSWSGSKCSQSDPEHKWCYYLPFPASQFAALSCLPLHTKQQPEESLKQSSDPKIACNSATSVIEKCVASRESMCKYQSSPNCRDVCLFKPTPLCFRGNNLLLK